MTTTKRKPSHWSRKLRLLGACKKAVAWAKTQSSYADAWRECKRSDWMMWLCDVTTTRSPTELLIEFCTYALEKARPVAGKEAYWAQVEGAHAQVCEALRGNGDIDAAMSAADAAGSAANAAWNAAWNAANAARSAAGSAANAARSAAWSAANAAMSAANAAGSAAWSAADAARNDLADIIRKHMPKPPKLPAKRGAS